MGSYAGLLNIESLNPDINLYSYIRSGTILPQSLKITLFFLVKRKLSVNPFFKTKVSFESYNIPFFIWFHVSPPPNSGNPLSNLFDNSEFTNTHSLLLSLATYSISQALYLMIKLVR